MRPLHAALVLALALLGSLLAGRGEAREVPVVVFLVEEGRGEWLRAMAEKGREDAPRDVFLSRAPEVQKRRGQLDERGLRLEGLGLRRWRASLAGNAVTGWCDEADVARLKESPLVAEVLLDQVLDAQMNVSVPTMLPEAFHAAGYLGQVSDFEVGILDAGIDGNHPAFAGLDLRYHIDHGIAVSDSTYNDSPTNPDDLSLGGHGTHIAGIIVGRAAPTWESHVGVAPGSRQVYNLKSGFRRTGSDTAGLYFSDALDNIDWGIFSAADDIDLLNFSWGLAATGDDSGLARFFDAVVDDLGVPVTIAAGNGGPSAGTVLDPAIAYNVLTIGATNDANTVFRGDDNVIGSSARGPTLGGRKKPDLVAPGFIIQSPTNFWETALDFNNVSGTSFSAPHALGAVQLVMDYLGPGVTPLQVKALLIGSASPGSFFDSTASIEWDPKWGWGYINLDRAWERRESLFSGSIPPAGQSGDYRLYRGPMAPVSRAALVWNRHVTYVAGGGQPSTAGSLNNLDLRLYDHDNNTLLDSSTSGIDNVEVVTVTARDYEAVVKVSSTSTSFSRVSFEPFTLSAPPGFVQPSTLPRTEATLHAIPGVPYRLVAIFSNSGGFHAHNIDATLSLPAGIEAEAGLLSSSQGTIRRGGAHTRVAEWSLRQSAGFVGTAQLSLSSASYGETYTGSASNNLGTQPTGLAVLLEAGAPAAGAPFAVRARVRNDAASTALAGSIELHVEAGLVELADAAVISLPDLAPGEEALAEWTATIPEAGVATRLFARAAATASAGGALAGGETLVLSTAVDQPPAVLLVEPVAPEQGNVSFSVQVRARITNVGEAPLASVVASLTTPEGFLLASGDVAQDLGALAPGESRVAGSWLFLTPATPTVGQFVLAGEAAGAAQSAVLFEIPIGDAELPPTPPFASGLADEPFLQAWSTTIDNDPVALGVLPGGEFVFFNAQPAPGRGTRSVVAWNPAARGTEGLRVLATEAQFQALLGTQEPVSVNDIAVADDGSVFVLARVDRTGKDPMAIIELPAAGDGTPGAPLLRVPPGLPPAGLYFTDDLDSASIAWDSASQRLLVLTDNGDAANDLVANGLHWVDAEAGRLQLVATFAQMAQAATPPPVPGTDPIGFTALAVDDEGNALAFNAGGSGANLGDIVRVAPSGERSLFVEADALLALAPANAATQPVRLAWSSARAQLGVLVADTPESLAGEGALLTTWKSDGSPGGVAVDREALLEGTNAARLVNYGQALATTVDGRWALWSALDNETLLLAPQASSASAIILR